MAANATGSCSGCGRVGGGATGGGLQALLFFLVLVVGIGAGVFLWYKSGYDSAVRQREAVDAAWAQVENQLQRRFDLIPNLVNTVKGYAAHEKELFEKIAEYRTEYFQAKDTPGKVRAANEFETVLSRLLLLQEQYPQLKADQTFLRLQDELAGTENRIAVERMRYNEAVRDIKAYAKTLFGRFFCRQAGVSADDLEYFEAKPEAQGVPPKVEF